MTQALRINPFRPGIRRLAFFGASKGHFTGVSFAATCRRWPLRLVYRVLICDIGSPLYRVLDELRRFQPDILMGYPSALALLAERQARGELALHLRWVQGSGEPAIESDRRTIETAFGVPLINVYSSTEHLIMGCGRPELGGMVLFEDDLIFELRGDHTLVTNLFNYTVPLIRYRMNDALVPTDAGQAGPYRLVRDVVGRLEHIPRFRNRHGDEDFISPHVINEFFVPGLRRFQLRQSDATSCRFCVCLEDGLDGAARGRALDATRARLGAIFADKEMDNVQFEVVEVSDLPVDPVTGKFRLVVPPPG